MPVITILERLRQEDCREFDHVAGQSYVAGSYLEREKKFFPSLTEEEKKRLT